MISASLTRISMLPSSQGRQDDAYTLRKDPAFPLAVSSAASLTPLEGPGLTSQEILSRFTAVMVTPTNLKILRKAVLELAFCDLRV